MSQLRVISYDIVDDKKRTKVSNILKDFGSRVQYSVFECKINEEQLSELKKRLTKAIDLKEDNIRIYSICQECKVRISVIGRYEGKEEESSDYFVI